MKILEGRTEDIILNNLNNEKIFVFPSEVSAQFWKKKALDLSDKKAVLSDKFISWDRFKENNFYLNFKEKPSNNIFRKYFIKEFLNNKSQYLKVIINPEYSYNSVAFEKYFISLLTYLDILFTDSLINKLPVNLKADLLLIYTEYKKYLAFYGLFEPSYVTLDYLKNSNEYFICYFSIIEDFNQFKEVLSNSDKIHLIKENSRNIENVYSYNNPYNEVLSCLLKIQEIMDDGCDFDNIAITITKNTDYEELLKLWSKKFDIKLNIKSGKAVTEYSSGKFFLLLNKVVSENYNISVLKEFLLDPVYPFKFKKLARKLISFGIEYNCLKNDEAGKFNDLWRMKLKKSGDVELLDFYLEFKKNIEIILKAKSFIVLKQSIYSFINKYFNAENWNDEEFKILQFSIESLDAYINSEKFLNFKGFDIFNFWLKDLNEKIYVKIQSEPGINVYLYKVSAAIKPKYHFILGFSEKASQIKKNNYPFLNEEYKNLFSDSEIDFTNNFFDSYSQAGENILFSYANDNSEGPQLAPSYWLKNNGLIHINEVKGPVEIEKDLWGDSSINIDSVYDFQLKSLDSGLDTIFTNKGVDYSASTIVNKEILNSLLTKLYKNKKLYISASSLKMFLNCPFSYFLNKSLSLNERAFEFQTYNSLDIGNIYHKILKHFSDSLFGAQKNITMEKDEHSSIMKESINYVLKQIEYRGLDFISPVWSVFKEDLVENLMAFIDQEHKYLRGFSYFESEKYLEYDYPESDILLNGHIDRTSEKDGDLLVIDYKLSRVPTKTDILSKEEKNLQDFQMAFYYYLLEKNGFSVKGEAYYSLIKQEYKTVLGDKISRSNVYFNDEEMADILTKLESCTLDMRNRIYTGHFDIGNESTPSCTYCSFANVCRLKYGVTLG